MNLEVDVMEGDVFTNLGGCVYQYRQEKWRHIALEHIGKWEGPGRSNNEKPLDLPTFKRYCDGCGLTVKMVKPEPEDDVFMDCLVDGCDCHCKKPAVETINPPEWVVVYPDGVVLHCTSKEAAEQNAKGLLNVLVKRIDWGAK